MPERLRRSPDTVTVMAMLVVGGLGVLLAGDPPSSFRDLLPGSVGLWVGLAWAASMVVAGVVVTIGVEIQVRNPGSTAYAHRLLGSVVELFGRIALAGSVGTYAWVLGARISSIGSMVIEGLLVAIAAASIWRIWQIRHEIRRWKRAVEHGGEGR